MPDTNMTNLYAYKIQRTYLKTAKYSLTLFIPPCETVMIQNGYNVNPMGILYLALPYKEGRTTKASLDIRLKNHMKVLRCISEALSWFDQYSDLYITQNNELYFNTNYNELAAKYRSEPMESPQALKLVPLVVEDNNGQPAEGVMLYINEVNNYIQLTRAELQELFDILYNFNFSTEVQLSYQALIMSSLTGKIGTQQQNYTVRFLK